MIRSTRWTEKLMQLHRSNEMSRRLATIAGIGPIGATLLSIKVVDARGFKSARNFAAWLGLTPKIIRQLARTSSA